MDYTKKKVIIVPGDIMQLIHEVKIEVQKANPNKTIFLYHVFELAFKKLKESGNYVID